MFFWVLFVLVILVLIFHVVMSQHIRITDTATNMVFDGYGRLLFPSDTFSESIRDTLDIVVCCILALLIGLLRQAIDRS